MKDFIERHVVINKAPIRLDKPWADFIDHVNKNIHSKQGTRPIVVRKARQVGMTTAARSIILATALTEEKAKLLHLFPTLALAANAGKDLDNIILDAPRGTKRKRNGTLKSSIEERIPWEPMANTLHRKKFDNDSYIFIETVGRDACRLRGLSADMIIFDEAQCMSQSAIFHAISLLRSSKLNFNAQIFSFTPKDEKHYTKHLWESSNKARWHYICPQCNHKFPLTMNNYQTVWLYGFVLQCPQCGKEFHKQNNGEWMADDVSVSHIDGFHFDQSMIPFFTKETIHKASLSPFNKPNIISEEIWGEWFNYDAYTMIQALE